MSKKGEILKYGKEIKYLELLDELYDSSTMEKIILYQEYHNEEEEPIDDVIRSNLVSPMLEELLHFSINLKEQESNHVYKLKTNLYDIISSGVTLGEKEIGCIVKFFLLLQKDLEKEFFIFQQINPEKFQFHRDKVKYLNHIHIPHPRRDPLWSHVDLFMAPEVIEGKMETRASKIWSLGILCLYMANKKLPLSELHPLRAIFMIPKRDPPSFIDESHWSIEFRDFVKSCLSKDPTQRLTIEKLLNHPFLIGALTEEDFIDIHLHGNSKQRVHESMLKPKYLLDVHFKFR